jgi:peptidoglycan/xylan/chitin deacetylase (PgdA/CDA1 family)
MKIRRWVDRLRARVQNGAAILLYHRVTRLARDPMMLSVTPEHFREHLEVLRRRAHVCSLLDIHRNRRAPPPGTIAITFDDGYADNLLEAAPVLERFDMPATVFIATGLLGTQQEFWWDDLERILLGPESSDPWTVEDAGDPDPKHAAFRAACRLLRASPPGEQARLLERFREENGAGPAGRTSHRVLTPEQVHELGNKGLLEIGAHTVNHPVLSMLGAPEQRDEMARSKQYLEDVIGSPVRCFAYPYGGRNDYDRASVKAARDAGFEIACANVPGRVWPDAGTMELPRILVRDCAGDRFEEMLEGILK